MANKYTTKTKVENYILEDIDASFSDQIDSWIEVVSKDIENYTKRVFTTTTEDRLFEGNGKRTLWIDDAQAINTVERADEYYGETFSEITDYITRPNNEKPITQVELKDTWFYKGKQNIKINADWGYSETTPVDIEFAATVLVAGIINSNRNAEGMESEKIGDYSIKYSTKQQEEDYQKAISILDSYTKYEL